MTKTHTIQTGNTQVDTTDSRGWLIGSFIEDHLDLRHSDDIELKWGVHRAGEAREEWVVGETRTAIGILISGTFEMEFRDQTISCNKPGDYVLWGPGVDHKWRALTNCTWLTVRWPSDTK